MLLPNLSKPGRNRRRNLASKYVRRLLIFLLCKQFHCISSTIHQHTIRSILSMNRKRNSRKILWTLRWCLQLATFDAHSLLALDCAALCAKVKDSNIQHDRVGCGEFLGKPFNAVKIVGYYYRTLVYSNLTTQKQFRKPNGAGILSLTVDHFSPWAFEVSETILDFTGKERSAWMVLTRLCGIWFTNDSRNLPRDMTTEMHVCSQPRAKNVSYVQNSSSDGTSNLKDDRITSIKALRNKNFGGGELYTSYGSEYRFL